MDPKLTFVFVVLVHVFINQKCQSYPIFNYASIFGGDESSEVNNDVPGEAPASARLIDVEPEVERPPVQPESVSSPTVATVGGTAGGRAGGQKLGNLGVPVATSTVGVLASMLSSGVRGLKSVVDGGSDLTKRALNGVSNLNNATIDTVQNAIDETAVKTLNRVASWTETMDMYRRALSGSAKKDADKAHSITITTSSNAPVDVMTKFWNKYTSGSGSSTPAPLPEITSLDFSQLW